MADFIIATQEKKQVGVWLEHYGATCEYKNLSPKPDYTPGGDGYYRIGDEPHSQWVGVEFKEAQDLVNSIVARKGKDGRKISRLDSQLERMTANYDVTTVYIHGWFGVTPDYYIVTERRTNWVKWDTLWNKLDKWQAAGVRLQFCVDRPHLARRLISIKKYQEASWRKEHGNT